MRASILIFCFSLMLFSCKTVISQDNEEVIEITEEQWELARDEAATYAIILLSKLEKLNKQIDSLNLLNSSYADEYQKCEDEIFALVGTSRSSIADFRKMFEDTERKINNRTGFPSDARRFSFDEINSGRIRCLPEFSDRFWSMKKKLEDWEGTKISQPEKTYSLEGTYTVTRGDNLSKISEIFYNSPEYWYLIWDANKNGIINKDYFYNSKNKFLIDPDYIYPEQILKIPSLKEIKQ